MRVSQDLALFISFMVPGQTASPRKGCSIALANAGRNVCALHPVICMKISFAKASEVSSSSSELRQRRSRMRESQGLYLVVRTGFGGSMWCLACQVGAHEEPLRELTNRD